MTRHSAISRGEIRTTMTIACQTWSKHTNIEFQEIGYGNPDIEVRFETRRHNDPFPFDGPGGTLAHAFYPLNNGGLAGDIHLDDEEEFTVYSRRGKNLGWVLTHELGIYVLCTC